jgi:hypothetical protein
MALTSLEVYYLRAVELRAECFRRGSDSEGTVRDLRERLSEQIRVEIMADDIPVEVG